MTANGMTADEIRQFIESNGRGDSIRQKVADASERSGLGESSLWRYISEGVPPRTARRVKKALEGLNK